MHIWRPRPTGSLLTPGLRLGEGTGAYLAPQAHRTPFYPGPSARGGNRCILGASGPPDCLLAPGLRPGEGTGAYLAPKAHRTCLSPGLRPGEGTGAHLAPQAHRTLYFCGLVLWK